MRNYIRRVANKKNKSFYFKSTKKIFLNCFISLIQVFVFCSFLFTQKKSSFNSEQKSGASRTCNLCQEFLFFFVSSRLFCETIIIFFMMLCEKNPLEIVYKNDNKKEYFGYASHPGSVRLIRLTKMMWCGYEPIQSWHQPMLRTGMKVSSSADFESLTFVLSAWLFVHKKTCALVFWSEMISLFCPIKYLWLCLFEKLHTILRVFVQYARNECNGVERFQIKTLLFRHAALCAHIPWQDYNNFFFIHSCNPTYSHAIYIIFSSFFFISKPREWTDTADRYERRKKEEEKKSEAKWWYVVAMMCSGMSDMRNKPVNNMHFTRSLLHRHVLSYRKYRTKTLGRIVTC